MRKGDKRIGARPFTLIELLVAKPGEATISPWRMRAKRRGKRSAFTLIELLVVVAIIMILMAILLPSLKKAKLLAHEIACNSNLKQIGTCYYLYGSDWDDIIIPVYGPVGEWAHNSWGAGYWGSNWNANWIHQAWRYMNYSDGALICPAAEGKDWFRKRFAETVDGGGWRKIVLDGKTWNREAVCGNWGSYGQNPYIQPHRGVPTPYGWRFARFRDIKKCYGPPVDPWELQWGTSKRNFGSVTEQVLVVDAWDDLNGMYSGHFATVRIDARHKGVRSTNVLFVDGHTGNKTITDRDFMSPEPRVGYTGYKMTGLTDNGLFTYWCNKRSTW